MVIGPVLCKPLLTLMGTLMTSFPVGIIYENISGMPANMLNNFAAAILNAVGDSRRPVTTRHLRHRQCGAQPVLCGRAAHERRRSCGRQSFRSIFCRAIMTCPQEQPGHTIHTGGYIDGRKLKAIMISVPADAGHAFSISNTLIQSAVNFSGPPWSRPLASSNVEGFAGTAMNAYYNAAVTFTEPEHAPESTNVAK